MSEVPGFAPSQKAPLFRNGPWPSSANLPISIMGLPFNINSSGMGLCGGIAFATRDTFEAGTPQLNSTDSSALPDRVVHYLQTRLVNSFQPAPPIPNTWLSFDEVLDHDSVFFGEGAFGRSVTQSSAVMADIDAGRLCPIGIVLVRSFAEWDVFQNHVVLVYGYEVSGTKLTLKTCDSNRPGDDTISISLDIAGSSPATPITTNGTHSVDAPGTIRGFFRLAYQHVDPAALYVDRAAPFVGSPSAVSWRSGRLDFFGVGTDGAMYQRAWDSDHFGEWVNLGGHFAGSPSAVSWRSGRLDFFGVGTD